MRDVSTSGYQKLRECPFCGGEPAYTTQHYGDVEVHVIRCDCGAGFVDDSDYVVEAWNNRSDYEVQAQNDRAVEFREAERTCRKGSGWYCQDCEQSGRDNRMRYCPNCGARVER